MTVSTDQKVDYLYKKLGYGVAKTDTAAVKSPSNEANASPLLIRGDTVWVDAGVIPNVAPSANTSILRYYAGTTAVQMVNDATSSTNRTWVTNLSDWVSSEFGATYQPRVWAAPAGTGNAAAAGTRLFPDGSGNNDAWFFDPQAGLLNFNDTNVPTAVSGNVVYIEGYRYIGPKGLANIAANAFLQNITITNTTISTSLVDGDITLTPTGNGIVHISGYTALGMPAGNTAQAPTDSPAGSMRYNTDLAAPEFWNGGSWTQLAGATITDQTITPDGANVTYMLNRSATSSGILVSINGIIQRPDTSYTVANNEITFTETPLTSDIVDIRFIAPGQITGMDLAEPGTPPPASSSAGGSPGTVIYDGGWVYFCVAPSTWVRANVETSF